MGAARSGPRSWAVLLGYLLLCLAVGRLGGSVTRPALTPWYEALAKPAYTPPDIAFPIAWTVLYVLMAVAAWLVWRSAGWRHSLGAQGLFLAQLAANLGWSWLFFGLRSPTNGLIGLALLGPLVILTAWAFARHSRAAGRLFLPYIAWVAFAALLNLRIWQLNP